MALSKGKIYKYLNGNNEAAITIQYASDYDVPRVYFLQNGTLAPSGSYRAASVAQNFTLYDDGSLRAYTSFKDGKSVSTSFAPPTPGSEQLFGNNNEYRVGAVTQVQIVTEEADGSGYYESKSFSNGTLTKYEFEEFTPTLSTGLQLIGTYQNGIGTVKLTSPLSANPITTSGNGGINALLSLDINRLIGQDGASVISDNGLGLIGQDGASIIGNDAGSFGPPSLASLIGQDGASIIGDHGGGLLSLGGGAASILSSSWAISQGQMVAAGGGNIVAAGGGNIVAAGGGNVVNLGATFAGNVSSLLRGYSLTSTSLAPIPQTDGVDSSNGGSGNDILRGGRGGDFLDGGAGDDLLYGQDSNLVRNGSFENIHQPGFDGGGYDILDRPLDGWSSNGAPIELFTTGSAGSPSDGRYGIDLEGGQAGANIALSQTVREAIDGQTYRVAFDVRKVSANASARLEVSWGGTKLSPTAGGAQYIDPTTSTTTYFLTVVGGAGTGANKNLLTFREIGGGDFFGTLLDNVRMFRDTPGSPNAKDPAMDGGDVFTPGTGSDAVFGHAGDDLAIFEDVGPGLDHFNGGSGNDLLFMDWSAANGAITFADFYTGSTANISGRIGLAQSYSLAASFGQSAQTLYFNEVERFILEGGSGADSLEGAEFADSLIGNGGADFLRGGGGADSITGGTGKDTLVGGSGNDVFFIAAGDEASGESISGGSDTDEIRTASSTLDLRGMVLSGIESIQTTSATGTAFTVSDATHIALLRGGSGADSVIASSLTLTSTQRSALFFSGIESVTDQTGTSTANTTPASNPTITGLSNQSINDTGVTNPFGGVSVGDPNGDLVTATVTLSNTANGVFTANSLASAGFTATATAGQYTSARISLNAVNTSLRALVFDPTNNQVASGQSVTTTFNLTVRDGNAGLVSGSSSISVLSANDTPVITSNGGGVSAFLSIQENETFVARVVAADGDPGQLTYSLVSGGDGSRFVINAASGALTFIAPPDFEQPGSTNSSNFYYAAVRVTDGSGAFDEQTFGVTVTDQNFFPGTNIADLIRADSGNDTVTGGLGSDTIFGGGGNDTLYGDNGRNVPEGDDDFFTGGTGNDTLYGDAGLDVAIYGIASTAASWTKTSSGWTVNAGTEGIDTLIGVEGLRFTDREVVLDLPPPQLGPMSYTLGAFGAGTAAGGWSSQDRYSRQLADVNGDGRADIVGFGEGGVLVSLATGNGGFGPMAYKLDAFGAGTVAGGWSSQDRYPRQLADVNGDGRADIVGFGEGGVLVSLATSNGGFGPMAYKLDAFGAGTAAGGWSSQDRYSRQLADVNGDGRADIVGFGEGGVLVSLATGDGGFGPMAYKLGAFGTGTAAGGWSSQERYSRQLADVDGDGQSDIVGFGEAGVLVSLATGNGGFGPMAFKLDAFGAGTAAGGWSSQDRYPRQLADVSGDGRADIVGFGEGGVLVSIATGNGDFEPMSFALDAFGTGTAAGSWSSQDRYLRQLADVDGDGRADIVGFGEGGVYLSLSEDPFAI